ncbi:MAG: AcrB/AcrD/AcrF family protein [SAR116 cluster bacterium]|nr:MAG: AcrB/AcrD/AcrF family protein [SAR116 cluster bacterium]
MILIRQAIERPAAVCAGVLLIILFGYVALQQIPIQLVPDVDRPVVQVETRWPGAAPAEVEREIINKQEEQLKGIEGLQSMEGRARTGRAQITLEFAVGQDIDRALTQVAQKLDRVSGYPAEADEPTLETSGSEDNPIAWFVLKKLPGNERPLKEYSKLVDDVITDAIERVPGVSRTNVYGSDDLQMQVRVRPEDLASYRLTVDDVVRALRNANASVSAGRLDEGKRRYTVRMESDLNTPGQVGSVVVRTDPVLGRVFVSDIANVLLAYPEETSMRRHLGAGAIPLNAVRETGANVIATMGGIRAVVDELNEGILKSEGLSMKLVYDETIYIEDAIQLVQSNIMVGAFLAAVILMIFLRSWRATLVVSIAIPVSVVGTFVAMSFTGRTVNVISLAGIAFAVGMVVDAAIVVLENIYRLREKGLPLKDAAFEGANQVWGAVLVSALTTVMVFIPIMTTDLEVGQLFQDIAVAISVSVMLSLLVSITLIPALFRWLFGGVGKVDTMRIPILDDVAAAFSTIVLAIARRTTSSAVLGLTLVAVLTAGSLYASWKLLPKLEYLPEGNNNFVFGVILPPPGYNLATSEGIALKVEDAVRDLWASETGPEDSPEGKPKFDNFFFVATETRSFIGGSSVDPSRAAELIPVMRTPIFTEPGTFGFINQRSIFGRGIGGGRAVDLDILGDDLEDILPVAQRAAGKVAQILPREAGHQFRPQPGLELGAPEVRVTPDYVRLGDNGMSAASLGLAIDAANEGVRVAEITVDGSQTDLILRGPKNNFTKTQDVESIPVVTGRGDIVTAASLANVEVTAGPVEIRHKERFRSITLQVRPSRDLPLEQAMEILQTEVIDKLEEEGVPQGIRLQLSGTADKLTEASNVLVKDLLLAIIIVYLVMVVLFESFLYPFVILFTVPVALAGGVGGLGILNLYTMQPLDMLTMLGFIILTGIVVNNAILVVDQALYGIRVEGLGQVEAILEATKNRLRPIFMSTITSLVGMLPLVLVPGAGSELYRGLGTVVVGGLALSSIITLLLMPPLIALVSGRGRKGQALGQAT